MKVEGRLRRLEAALSPRREDNGAKLLRPTRGRRGRAARTPAYRSGAQLERPEVEGFLLRRRGPRRVDEAGTGLKRMTEGEGVST
jgi:hypothetical protein